jgi:threonine dehydratase
MTLVPPFDDPLIVAGQGTAAVELFEDVNELDCLVVPCSGCGLLAGCAVATKHLHPSTRIFGVEPEAGNDTWQSMRKGERVEIDVPKTIADGLQAPSPGKLTFPIVKELVEDILLVSDDELMTAMRFILERMKVLVEPSGAAGAAAMLHRKLDVTGKRVGVILSGGNVDLAMLAG